MKIFLKVLMGVLLAIYPVIIFMALVVFKLPMKIVSLVIMGFGFASLISVTTARQKKFSFESLRPFISALLLLAAGLACFLTNKDLFIKLYAVVISLSMLIFFGSTLIIQPNIIFRFATLSDKTIKGSIHQKAIERYCYKVCVVWCIFFILNGSACAFVALYDFGSPELNYKIWSLYTGGISYVLMGLLFAIEYIVRRIVNSKMKKPYSISNFTHDCRTDDTILCYEGKYSDGIYKTWKDFLVDTAKFRAYLNSRPETEYILHCEDYWLFLVTFVSLLQCKKRVHLVQNTADYFIDEIKKEGFVFLSDQKLDSALYIEKILEEQKTPSESEIRCSPKIVAEETDIRMYTSGSTGKPKAVQQRLKEFEEDNGFIISKFGYKFEDKYLVTTVSQHHIYGFLFGISLPFTIALPFRRKRIEFPDEFDSLTDGEYVIIATPAFLKRTNESKTKLPLKNCEIFSSGGMLLPEVAKKSNEVFGSWPIEVYGSTETSGIAWRISRDGLEWTPFENAKVWKDEEGCLRIISPYIKDPNGFATADMVDMLDDGRFLLKGRKDSIVKIEEKRISMTEVENRILETGLVHDVKVIALENEHRQYLAAVIELNGEGKAKFKNERKLVLNKYFHDFLLNYFENIVIPKKWRFVEKIPADIQGKKRLTEIKALFTDSKEE